MLQERDLQARIAEFVRIGVRNPDAGVMVIDDPSPVTDEDFVLRGSLTIRHLSALEWGRDREHGVSKVPAAQLLFLEESGVAAQPLRAACSAPVSSLEVEMFELMRRAGENGDVVFVVGPTAERIPAHRLIVENTITVPLFHGMCREGAEKEVHLPETQVEVFRALLTYVYTRAVSDADMRAHALALMAEADKYHLEALKQKCVAFLCWKVQVMRSSCAFFD
jgi:hypothetical protein